MIISFQISVDINTNKQMKPNKHTHGATSLMISSGVIFPNISFASLIISVSLK